MKKNGKSGFGKDIFHTGEYLKYFKPDNPKNPFSKIYNQKKRDTLGTIHSLENCKKVLDIGGGMGRVSLALARLGEYEITLTDISVDMLKLAHRNREANDGIDLVNADAHHLPFSDSCFDLIVGLDLVCHLKKPKSVLREFHRILKKSGVLILDSTNSNPIWTLFYPRYMGKNPINWIKTFLYGGIFPGWEKIVKHYPQKTFFTFLKDAGFQIYKTIDYGPIICPKWHLAISRKISQEI